MLAVLLFVVVTARGQYDASFSHYWDMEPSFNPAAVGKQSKVNVAAAYAMAMAGFENNPKTMYLAADMPFYFLNSYHGTGVQLLNDQIGLFSHQRVALQDELELDRRAGFQFLGSDQQGQSCVVVE